jgi:hypothetical protein
MTNQAIKKQLAAISSDQIIPPDKEEKLVRILYLFAGGNEKTQSDYFVLRLLNVISFLKPNWRFWECFASAKDFFKF